MCDVLQNAIRRLGGASFYFEISVYRRNFAVTSKSFLRCCPIQLCMRQHTLLTTSSTIRQKSVALASMLSYLPSTTSRNNSRTLSFAACKACLPRVVDRYTFRSDLPFRSSVDFRYPFLSSPRRSGYRVPGLIR